MPPETIRYPSRMTEFTASPASSGPAGRPHGAGAAFAPQFAQLLLYCRPGFENECAAEISDAATGLNVAGYCRAKPDSGYVLFVPADPADMRVLRRGLRFADLVFPRQLLFAGEIVADLPLTDRAGPLTAAASVLAPRFSDLLLETADTNEAKELSTFLHKFEKPFAKALRDCGLLGDGDEAPAKPRASKGFPGDATETPRQEPIYEGPAMKFTADAPSPLPRPEGAGQRGARLHVFFLSSSAAICAISDAGNRSDWHLGIPRLRMPKDAPSRSTLKLAEAFLAFELEDQLRPGQTAVDLGAAPGGWTYQLVRRGIHVTAVDNGPMDKALLGFEMVEHLREDGLKYRPKRPVDWLVCDMVESPSRIARVIADWLAEGKAAAAVFNLKLPMKRRYDELETCRALIETRLDEAGFTYTLAARQLYHDREEVTVFVRAEPPVGGIRPAEKKPERKAEKKPAKARTEHPARAPEAAPAAADYAAFSTAPRAAKGGKSAGQGTAKGAAAPKARNYFSDADDSAFDALGEFSAFTPGRPAGNKGSGKAPRSGAAAAAKPKAGRPGPAGKTAPRPAAGKSRAWPGAKPVAKSATQSTTKPAARSTAKLAGKPAPRSAPKPGSKPAAPRQGAGKPRAAAPRRKG